ncbi:molybdate transport system substrate-binding protein [Desulfurobacterium pacificum]|uniref:Molybdate transport system substrate-binding protein n=1 Tax=Desulfurobacterium pacificum TaxID=240166 RepID=A0ABY1NTZ3_9BACT|nr:molybdate ABC transporter substrate-binding protein [Desulfurobacterium pacificum]SMP18085.1 molybdate transport system substrate-binding protein [Desulfurobacterium pacificum]
MRILLFLLFFQFFFLPSSLADVIRLSAAMGTKDLINYEVKQFNASHNSDKVVCNFSSSGKLATQIEAGAPADIYISASKYWMDYLLKKGFIVPDSAKPFASTDLVLVVPLNSHIGSIMEAKKIAIGNRLAPVGKYAIETLKNLGIYEKLKSRFVYAPTVRQISVWVMTGNTDAGIIYYSDYVRFKDRLKLLKVFPDNLHRPITFWIGIVRGARNASGAEKFENFILNADAEDFKKFGFKKVTEGLK